MKSKKSGIIIIVTLILLLTVTSVIAHDFWLIPEFFNIPSGLGIHVYANNGSVFPESLNAVDPGRISYAKIVGKNKTVDISNMKTIENSLVLDVKPPSDGQWIIGVQTKPRTIDMTGKEFNEYLDHDGIPNVYDIRKKRGELDKAVTEFYQKSAKTIIQCGNGGPKAWSQILGHYIEFVPLSDPAEIKAGDTLRFKLLFHGKPLADAIISSGHAGIQSHTHASGEEHTHAHNYRTDSDGVVGVKVTEKGKWYIETTYMVETPDKEEYDWHSFWATMTFEVK